MKYQDNPDNGWIIQTYSWMQSRILAGSFQILRWECLKINSPMSHAVHKTIWWLLGILQLVKLWPTELSIISLIVQYHDDKGGKIIMYATRLSMNWFIHSIISTIMSEGQDVAIYTICSSTIIGQWYLGITRRLHEISKISLEYHSTSISSI